MAPDTSAGGRLDLQIQPKIYNFYSRSPAAALVAAQFLILSGPDHQAIEVNSAEIVALRAPRSTDHFAPGTQCLIFTADGKYVAVMQTCQRIDEMLKQR